MWCFKGKNAEVHGPSNSNTCVSLKTLLQVLLYPQVTHWYKSDCKSCPLWSSCHMLHKPGVALSSFCNARVKPTIVRILICFVNAFFICLKHGNNFFISYKTSTRGICVVVTCECAVLSSHMLNVALMVGAVLLRTRLHVALTIHSLGSILQAPSGQMMRAGGTQDAASAADWYAFVCLDTLLS